MHVFNRSHESGTRGRRRPGNATVSTASGCAWTAGSNAPWISVTSGAAGSGNGTVGYAATPNTTTSSRTGTLTIAGQTLTVTQVACSYTLSPTTQNIAAVGGPASATVSTTSGCPWTGASNATWLSVTSGSPGSGNGPVNYSAATNTSTTPRTGTLTIAGRTLTVTQAGACSLYGRANDALDLRRRRDALLDCDHHGRLCLDRDEQCLLDIGDERRCRER